MEEEEEEEEEETVKGRQCLGRSNCIMISRDVMLTLGRRVRHRSRRQLGQEPRASGHARKWS